MRAYILIDLNNKLASSTSFLQCHAWLFFEALPHLIMYKLCWLCNYV